MRVLLASDLDGTLIFENNISDENKDAISRFKEAGGIFAISTGRPFNGVEKVIHKFDIKADYMILNNGALIMDGHENIVHKKHIKYDAVKDIVEKINNKDTIVSVETGFYTYAIDLYSKDIEGTFMADAEKTFNNFKSVKALEDINGGKEVEFTLISIFMPNANIEKVQEVCDYINDNYGKYVIAYRNTNFIDVVPEGCSKGNGVKWVSDKENINIGDVYTIGDSWNDDSMFEITDKSFTFTYAEKDLQKKTEHIVETVAECINNYILK